ncbi:MAG: hypothetical protein EOM19_01490 [Candidatus Moranbacteria bacterium]|nr:hypothetical protein [Candidatus Moranbacteria bacterium]
MTEIEKRKPRPEATGMNILVSETSRNGLVLIVAILFVSIMSGILGAFKNGEFQQTYDFVQVEKAVSEINFEEEIFSQMTKKSRQVIYDKEEVLYNEELGETYVVTTSWFKGYYKSYFYESSWFYLETMMNTITVTIFYIALINFLIAKKKTKDVVYLKLTGDINDIVVEKNNVPSTTFEPFLDDWNSERKKRQFKANIRYKISKLERKTPFKIKKIFKEKNEEGQFVFVREPEFLKKKFKIFTKNRIKQRRANRYINRKMSLESFLTSEYISENVLYERVKYFKYIYASFIYNGKNGIHKTTDEYSAITSNDAKKNKDLFKKMVLGLAATLSFATVLSFTLFSANENWLIVVYNVALKLLPFILQWILGIDYSNRYMSDQLIPTQKYRLNIINMYLSNREKYNMIENKKIAEGVS